MSEDLNTGIGMELEDMPDDVWYGTKVVSSPIGEGDDGEDLPPDDEVYVDPRVDPEIGRKLALYDGKNEYLRKSPLFREIDTLMFLHLLFCRGEDDGSLPFEEEWCESYAWWTQHERNTRRPAEFQYIYNGIAQAIYGKRQKEKKNKTFVITSRAERMNEMLQHPFVIISPVSYTGKRRTKANARYLYAIAIDIDDVDVDNLDNLLYQSDPTRPHITFPQPQIIVNSGSGIHAYFLLETPAPMFKNAYPILNKIKKELTRRIWNKGTTHADPNKPQFQGNCQGFRVPGTQTKFFTRVTAFQNLNPKVKPYYTISDLTYNGNFLTEEEVTLLRKGTYKPGRVTLQQARELYPDWYERRIVQGHKSGRWYIKRDLYDWWKGRIMEGASVGHRYFCLMALAVYATKCAIPEEEFKADLLSFVEPFDGLSYTRKEEDRFTVEDALDAAAAYKESYCTFPIEDLRDITGIEILRNQTRKFRKQAEHLRRARIIRDGLHENWRDGCGRKNKQSEVLSWIMEHPGGTKYACAKELGIDKKTVMKWWVSTPEEAKETYDRATAEEIPQEAFSVAQRTMESTRGYSEQTTSEIAKTGRSLANAIDHSEISPENIAKMMGYDDETAKRLAGQFLQLAQNPVFWQMYLAANPNGIPESMVPPGAREALNSVIERYKKDGEIG